MLAGRLTSLDAFRGFVIASMLLVNNAGNDAAFNRQFRHSEWGEFVTFCDLIFPWFLFIIGVALPFSAASLHRKRPGLLPYILKVLRRSFLLFSMGVLIDCSIWKTIKIGLDGTGVLHLIALAYLCGALLYELPKRWRLGIAGGLLMAHWAAIRFVPIPGVGTGVFEPDNNLIAYVNQHLRPYHLAGIFSVVPTTALVLIGSFFGDLLRGDGVGHREKLRGLLAGGTILALVGLVWHLDLPMNKAAWSASYIVFGAGSGALLLAGFYWAMEMAGGRGWAFPFVVYGMNAITAYFFSIIVREHTVKEWIITSATGEKITVWQWLLHFWMGNFGTHAGAWMFTLSYLVFWWLVLLWLYRKGWFLRV